MNWTRIDTEDGPRWENDDGELRSTIGMAAGNHAAGTVVTITTDGAPVQTPARRGLSPRKATPRKAPRR